jgi:hypothetical protein
MNVVEMPRSTPAVIATLQKLEAEIRPVRRVIAENLFLGSWRLGMATRLARVWINGKIKVYEDWESNASSRFESTKKIGKRFLLIMKKVCKEAENEKSPRELLNEDKFNLDRGVGKSPDRTIFSALDRELAEHFLEFPADQESWDFDCFNHEFLEVPGKDQLSDDQKRCLDSEMRVTRAWLSNLLKQFSDRPSDVLDQEMNSVLQHEQYGIEDQPLLVEPEPSFANREADPVAPTEFEDKVTSSTNGVGHLAGTEANDEYTHSEQASNEDPGSKEEERWDESLKEKMRKYKLLILYEYVGINLSTDSQTAAEGLDASADSQCEGEETFYDATDFPLTEANLSTDELVRDTSGLNDQSNSMSNPAANAGKSEVGSEPDSPTNSETPRPAYELPVLEVAWCLVQAMVVGKVTCSFLDPIDPVLSS